MPDLLSGVLIHQADVSHAREKTLYEAVCSASTWLDGAENALLSGPVLLSDDSEIQLCHLEVRFCCYHDPSGAVNGTADDWRASLSCRD